MLHAQARTETARRPLRLPDVLVREALAPGAFVALILASNYALAGLPNVKWLWEICEKNRREFKASRSKAATYASPFLWISS